MQLRRDFSVRQIAGIYLLVPMGNAELDLNHLITLNEVGAAMWKLLPNAQSAEDIVWGILQEYDSDEKSVRDDVKEFLCKLSALEIL